MSLKDREKISRIIEATTRTTTGTATTRGEDAETGTGTGTGTESCTREDEQHQHHQQKQQQQQQQEDHDNDTHNTSTLFQSNQIRFHHLAAATGLIVTYFIEIIVQIFLIVHCCQPFILFTSAWWDWSWFLAISFLISSLVVTVVSIIWVCRGLDFAGRLCGRLLCYVMHSLLLGLLWRYLKLAFVYDNADVQEFVALRIFQAYFQSLPLTSIHLAWLINSRENWSSVVLGIVLVEFLSIVTALILSSYIKSDDQRLKSKGEVMEIIVKNLNCSSGRRGDSSCSSSDSVSASASAWPKLLETQLRVLSRSLLLSSRLVVIGILLVHLRGWTVLFILAHLILSFTWISFSVNNISSSSRSTLLDENEMEAMDERLTASLSFTRGKDFISFVSEWSYILFWDVTFIPSAISLWTWILPVLLVMLENGSMILFHWFTTQDPVVTIMSGSSLLIGWLLFSSLNFISTYHRVVKCCSPHPLIKETKTGITKDKSQQTQTSALPVIHQTILNTHPSHTIERDCDELQKSRKSSPSNSLEWKNKDIPPSWDLGLFTNTPSTLPNTYNNINEIMTKVRAHVFQPEKVMNRNGRKFKGDSSDAATTTMSNTMSNSTSCPPEGGRSQSQSMSMSINPSQSPLLAPTTWVPDTCCNDSNGSSNSRNTNTLRDIANPLPDQDHDHDLDHDTDIDNANFVFYFPTDTSLQQSVTSARFQKCSDRSSRNTSAVVGAFQSPNPNPNSNPTPIPPPHEHYHHHEEGESHPTAPTGVVVGERERDRRAKKKSARSSSISSFRHNVRRYRSSTPVEIKKASRILVNAPASTGREHGSKHGSRCYCYAEMENLSAYDESKGSSRKETSAAQYEKLIEDSYGILICEGEPSTGMCGGVLYKDKVDFQPTSLHSHPHPHHSLLHHHQSSSSSSKKLKVLCAKCLQNHDPLLTNCLETDLSVRALSKDDRSQILLALGPSSHYHHLKGRSLLNSSLSRTPPIPTLYDSIADEPDEDDPLPSDTTDYPSETEMTCTLEGDDQLSVSSNLSTATYTTWPHQSQPNLSMWTTSTMMPQSRFPKEFTSLEYVRTWLLTSQARLWQHRHHHARTMGRQAKKVYRSNTVSAQSRRVRFVGVTTKDTDVESSASGRRTCMSSGSRSKSLGRRRGPVGCGPSLTLRSPHENSASTSSRPSVSATTTLSFQPPPRQKQHPLLPHCVIPHPNGFRSPLPYPNNCHTSSELRRHEHSNLFYKDVEIIL